MIERTVRAGRPAADGPPEPAVPDGAAVHRWLRRTARIAALAGGPVFLVGTVLHPARDGHGIAAAGHRYGLTHDVQAAGLLALAIALAAMIGLGTGIRERRDLKGWFAALTGTVLWFGLIIFDGSHNPLQARHVPGIVHTPADLDPGAAFLVFPALAVFPLGYLMLAVVLARGGLRSHGLLLGVGSLIYTLGGLFIFTNGPRFPLIQIFEVIGAALYAFGFVLLSRSRAAGAGEHGSRRPGVPSNRHGSPR